MANNPDTVTLAEDTAYVETWHRLYGIAPAGMFDSMEDDDEEEWW